MILVALGANLPSRFGDAANTIEAAIQSLQSKDIEILARSRLWLTAPVPVSDQPWFHNAVVSIRTDFKPGRLLAFLHEVEEDFGRVRNIRNEARILDLDLITYNAQVIDEPGFHVPHPRLHERAFVLLPIGDIDPDWRHPALDEKLSDMLDKIPESQKAHAL